VQEEIMRVAKWGDRLAVRLPLELVEKLGVKEGDEISMTLSQEATEPTLVVNKADVREEEISFEERLDKLRSARRPLPAGYAFNRDEANER
jgi:antitoxin MazE